MEVTGYPRADIADNGHNIQQSITNRDKSLGKVGRLELVEERAEHLSDGWFQHLIRLHKTLGKL